MSNETMVRQGVEFDELNGGFDVVTLKDFRNIEMVLDNAVKRAIAGKAIYRRKTKDGHYAPSFSWTEFVPPMNRVEHYNAGYLACRVFLKNNAEELPNMDYRAAAKLLAYVASRGIYLSYFEISDGLQYSDVYKWQGGKYIDGVWKNSYTKSNDFIAQKVSFESLYITDDDGNIEERFNSWSDDIEYSTLYNAVLQSLTPKEASILGDFKKGFNIRQICKRHGVSSKTISVLKKKVHDVVYA